MIAATAVCPDYRVAMRDLRSFPRIEGLEILVTIPGRRLSLAGFLCAGR
jgi:hypothetical protein